MGGNNMKKKRTRITRENFLYDEPCRSILQLFTCFYNTKEWTEHGLTFEHLRLALVKGKNIEKIDGIFGERLRTYVDKGLIKPNCVKTKKELNNTYLKKLLKLKVITKDSRFKKPKYFLSEKFFINFMRILNKDSLEEYSSHQVLSFKLVGEPTKIVMYGIPQDMFQKEFTAEDTKKMYEHFTAIENHIKKIECIKIAKLYQRLLEKGVKKTKHDFVPRIKKLRCICKLEAERNGFRK